MSDRVRPAPAKYKTTNWRRYNQALKARGALMIWLDRDLQWSGLASGQRGRTPLFSDAAIQFCLTIKALFGLALRPRTTHLVGQPPPNPIRRRRLARTPRPPGTPGGEGEIRSSQKLLDSRITCTAGEAIINSTGRSTASSSSKSSCTALKAYLLKKWGRSVPMHSCMVSADRPVRSPSLLTCTHMPYQSKSRKSGLKVNRSRCS